MLPQTSDGRRTRAGDKLAAVRGDSQLWLYAVTSRDTPPAMSCANANPTGGQFADPTWSPDGRALAWAEADGIWTATVGTVTADGCGHAFAGQQLTLAGAHQPDWGPADPGPALRPDVVPPTVRLRPPGDSSVRRLLTGRLAVQVTASEDSTLTATLGVGRRTARRIGLRRSRIVAHGRRSARAGQPTGVTLRALPRARRTLKRARRLTATVRIVATDSAGNASRPRRAVLILR